MPIQFAGGRPPEIEHERGSLVLGQARYNEDLTEEPNQEAVTSFLGVWGDKDGGPWHLMEVAINHWPGTDKILFYNGIRFLVHYRTDDSWNQEDGKMDYQGGEKIREGILDPGFGAVTHISVTPGAPNKREGGFPFVFINGSYYSIGSDFASTPPRVWINRPAKFPYTMWKDTDGTQMGSTSRGVTMIHFGFYSRAVGHTIFNKPDEISVFDSSSGETLKKLKVAGHPMWIFGAKAPGWCYVAASSGVVTIIDYLNGRVVGVMRQRPPSNAVEVVWGWHGKHQRLYRYVRKTGGGTKTDHPRGWWWDNPGEIQSFWPTPIAIALQDPIPLKAPRPGRRVPFLTRAFGDTGEGIVEQIDWDATYESSELDEEDNPVGFVPLALSQGRSNEAGFNTATAALTQDHAGADARVAVSADTPYHIDTDPLKV